MVIKVAETNSISTNWGEQNIQVSFLLEALVSGRESLVSSCFFWILGFGEFENGHFGGEIGKIMGGILN